MSSIRIGWVKKAARKGDRIRVYFDDRTSVDAIAQTDIIDSKVAFIGGYAFSGNEPRIISVDRPKVFKSKASYEEGGYYPYLTVARSGSKVSGIYPEIPVNLIAGDFPDITDINLTHLGNGLSAIALLYQSRAIVFVDKTNTPVEKAFNSPGFLSGNIAWSYEDGHHPPVSFNHSIYHLYLGGDYANYNRFRNGHFNDPWYFHGSGFLGEPEAPDEGLNLVDGELVYESYTSNYSVTVDYFDKGTGVISLQEVFTPGSPDVFTPRKLFNWVHTRSWSFNSNCPVVSTDEIPRSGVMTMTGTEVQSAVYDLDGSATFPDVLGNHQVSATFSLTNNHAGNISGSYSNPVIINDFQTLYQTSDYQLSRSGTSSISTSFSLYNSYVPTEVEQWSWQLSGSRQKKSIELIFSKGIASLYLTNEYSIQESIIGDRDTSGSQNYRFLWQVKYQPTQGQPYPPWAPYMNTASTLNHQSQQGLTQESYSFSITSSLYKIAYREGTIDLDSPGCSFSSDVSDAVISAIAQGSGSITINALIPSNSRYRSSQNVETVKDGLNVTETITNGHTDIPSGSASNPLKSGENLVMLTTKNNETYLSICAIASFEYTDTTENDNPFNYISSIAQNPFSSNWFSRSASQVNLSLTIIKSKKIKVAYLPGNKELFGFPVKGAAVFRAFPGGRISFFEKPLPGSTTETRKFFAVTMLPISPTGTQSLVFEIVGNDIVFLDVMGGEVENAQVDASFANQWVQFFPDSTPKSWL